MVVVSGPTVVPSRSRYPEIILQSAQVAFRENGSNSDPYENRTKSAKSGGLETNGPRERIPAADGGQRGAEVWARIPAVIADFSALKTGRRKLAPDGLAEGEILCANSLFVIARNVAQPR